MKNLTKYTKLVLLTSVLLKIHSGYASQNEYDNTQSSSVPNAMPETTSSENTPAPLYLTPSPNLINPVLSLPQDVQGLILGELNRPSLESYSRTNKETYNTLHAPQDNPNMRAGICQALSTSTFNLDQPEETERLISYLNDTNTSKIYTDINLNVKNLEALDWPKILPLCTNIRFITFCNDDWEWTPLILALMEGLNNIAFGIISTLKENNPAWLKQYLDHYNVIVGTSALVYSIDAKDEKTALLLIEAGASLDPNDFRRDTALTVATENGLTDVVTALINKMKEVDAAGLHQYLNHQDRRRKTALMIASEKGYSDIVTILQQAGATQ